MSKPLRLQAVSSDDLISVSACLQDAAIKVSDIAFIPKAYRFAFVGNRYRWEYDERGKHGQRVRSACRFENVLKTSSKNIPLNIENHVLSFLSIHVEAEADGGATIFLLFSGDASIKLQVECIEAFVEDIGAPWRASRRPHHDENNNSSDTAKDESFEE